MVDVLVLGAGLAGASTAVHLARAGLSVQLLDRATFPRPKVCGEGLFARGVEALDELGVFDQVRQQGRDLHSLRLELEGVAAEGRLPAAGRPAMGIKRAVLDASVLEQARLAGADICLGVTALDFLPCDTGFRGVRTDHGDFTADAIVLADGLRSRLRRVAGLDVSSSVRRYGVSAHLGLEEDVEPRVRIRLLGDHEIYVTPVGEREINVAVLVGTRLGGTLAGDLQGSFLKLVRDGGMLPENADLLDMPMAAGPFPARARRLWADNVVLAGDAAGFFDGITGEGMSLALVSSKMVAEAVAAYLQDGAEQHFAAYESSRCRLERNSTLLARASLLLASNRKLGRYAIGNLGKHRATFEKLLAINAGTAALSTLTPRDFSRFLLGV